jgi:hypothetical protein
LDEIPTKVFRVFLLAIHSHLYVQLSLEISIFKLSQRLIVSSVQLLYNGKEKGGKPYRKPYPLSYGLRNPYKNLTSENSQDYAQKPQRNCTFMNSASGKHRQNVKVKRYNEHMSQNMRTQQQGNHRRNIL